MLRSRFVRVVMSAMLATGCASATPVAESPKRPAPTPASITKSNPGGDADDPHRAALTRLLHEPWGTRADRYGTMRLALPDSKNWQKVTLFGFPTRVAYRFGDDHYGVVAVWYEPSKDRDDPDACLKSYLDEGHRAAEEWAVRLVQGPLSRQKQEVAGESRPIAIRAFEGSDETSGYEYLGAIAAYESWPGTCLVQAFGVKSRDHRDLAEKVLSRWINEGAKRLVWEHRVREAPTHDAR